METFISILRGINVSGQKKILMADLKALYENLGFSNVVTYIQSGNVIFKADTSASDQDLVQRIEKAILTQYAFEVPVIVRRIEEMETLLQTNPFLADQNLDRDKLHVTFLAQTPEEARLESLAGVSYSPDQFTIIGKNVFLYCPVSYGNTKFSNQFFETKLKVTATTRNWKTVNQLVELAKNN